MSDIWQFLKAPFPPSAISWRLGATNKDKTKGIALAYIDARDVMDRLDSVVGPESWQNKYTHTATKTVCDIGLFINGQWIWKADGAGDSDVEAEKGALSDAFKRAAVRWGVGRYLYSLGNTWVEIESKGNSYAIKAREFKRLEATLPTETGTVHVEVAMPSVAGTVGASKAGNRQTYDRLVKEIRNISGVGKLGEWYASNVAAIDAMTPDWIEELRIEYSDRQRELKERLAA